ncbi:hypothetical protein GQ43DRAFT_371498 [Delitschia confertaspora ATCC 74209]|uniref:Uncharacterized protein n=1 Tax=Delitschia confertaspora ATCC 74209 TaxID=1513339 RepID=A0A9P4JQU5_9PLEO|nr:hypothetical protein GQ43DRAFT_371498 [Delitschia confertaspora ATCC 74209]
MLGRLMIGKIPEDATSRDVIDLLSQIPLPGDPGSLIMNGIEWIKAAISELQRTGCAESFYVEGFVKEAYSSAKKWESSNRSKGPKKVNYTRSRTFP